MKEITVKIPDELVDSFMELLTRLKLEIAPDIEITEAHKTIVRERIKNSDSEKLISWEDARQLFEFKK
jgi:hypothetical protein